MIYIIDLWGQSRTSSTMELEEEIQVYQSPIEQTAMGWSLAPSRYKEMTHRSKSLNIVTFTSESHDITLHLRPKISMANSLPDQWSHPRVISTYAFVDFFKHSLLPLVGDISRVALRKISCTKFIRWGKIWMIGTGFSVLQTCSTAVFYLGDIQWCRTFTSDLLLLDRWFWRRQY